MADIGSALMHIGGGMARGFGAGMQEDILELRRQAHAELERGFRREEREASQTFQAGQNELGRKSREEIAELDRRAQSDRIRLTDQLANAKLTDLARLIKERDDLPADSSVRSAYDEAIKRLGTGDDTDKATRRLNAVDRLIKDNTKEDPFTGLRATDWGQVERSMRAAGMEPPPNVLANVQSDIASKSEGAVEAALKKIGKKPGMFGGSQAQHDKKLFDETNRQRQLRGLPPLESRAEPPKGNGTGGAATPKMPPKPAQYPDAKWSEKAKAWVVQKDGKWFAVE